MVAGLFMAKDRSNDPTTDPKFQRVVQHFLTTPHKPHKTATAAKRKAARKQKSGK